MSSQEVIELYTLLKVLETEIAETPASSEIESPNQNNSDNCSLRLLSQHSEIESQIDSVQIK